ncbi:DUF721 domain-containing protein [Gulosibacter sp. 10]|uniref:DUF721 domain-containing protein n=1 Tax=Gulosibacter sp. 10 TaxID=1255570 RepID=UPI00097ED6F7|nr:DciA family protein [Gulosibacter sp. 10]SJM63300.1 Zn-ribbon-containing, possibly RNA-binding protein and truncated derivatives [Gulosibacter sp. 10]
MPDLDDALEGPPASETTEVWQRFKEVFGGRTTSFHRRKRKKKSLEAPKEEQFAFGPGREPVDTGDLLSNLFQQYGWEQPLAQARVIDSWTELAGERTAEHARPLYVEDGTLVVQCDSTAWATQLRTMRSNILGTIAERVPDAGIEDLRFLNPGAPSWKHGPRSISGRGPRDTYG